MIGAPTSKMDSSPLPWQVELRSQRDHNRSIRRNSTIAESNV